MIWALVPLKIQRFIIKGGIVCGIVLATWFGLARHYENKGVNKVLRTSKIEGAQNNAKNSEIRNAAERPGAAERVRHKYCGDC